MKKHLSLITAAVLAASLLAGCSSGKTSSDVSTQSVSQAESASVNSENSAANSEDTSETNSASEENTGFTLEYPEDMQAIGFTEPLVLEQKPERVVALSAAPVLALYELGVELVGIPSSRVVTWPEDLAENAATVSFSVMSPEDFDYESVVALEPDLVLLAMNGAETAGAKLDSLGINVYYLYAGHTVSYDSIKMQTEALINAFGTDEASKSAGEAIMQRFSDLEAGLENAKAAFAGKSVMVLQSGSADMHYIQTKDGTLGSMLDMIGFANVFENEASSMVQLDYEQALDYDPDYVVCVGGTDAETHKAVMNEAFTNNPEYWNAIPAVAAGNVTYVDVTYCSTAGINVIDNISNLIIIMSENTGITVG